MRVLLPLLLIFCLTPDIAKACCWGWGCCTEGKKPVIPATYKPSAEDLEEQERTKARLHILEKASITEVDKAACTALGIRYTDLLNLKTAKRTTGTIIAQTRRTSLTRTLGIGTSLDFFQKLTETTKERKLTPGEIRNCRKHLGITEEALEDLRKLAREA